VGGKNFGPSEFANSIQRFLAAGCIQQLIITRLPIILGSGIPLFGPLTHEIRLRHIATRQFANGFVQSQYEVVG
jgi:dihydrofolate reductase